jgi:LmbE family N-acetylglucosaminyl deacetylase
MRNTFKGLAALLLAATLAAGSAGCVDGAVRLPDTDLAGPRLLVIAPHPDDETVGAGGAIALARQRGWDVTVVYVTSGDGFWQAVRKPGDLFPKPDAMREYGTKRVGEARRASERLGVPSSSVIFLGFPDGAESDLWNTNWDSSNPRRAANGATAVPYPFALEPGAPYAGGEVETQIEEIVRRVGPTTVLLPDPGDVNRDHWAVAAFAQAALARAGFRGLALTYLVHRSGFPAPLGMHPEARLEPPQALAGGATQWFALPLGRRETDAQRAALAEHKTQLKADGRLVESFVRANALLGVDAPSTLGTGTLDFPQVHDRVFKAAAPSTSITRVSLRREEASATLTVRLQGAVDPTARYVLRARSIGPQGRWSFWGGTVANGQLKPLRDSKLEVGGPGRLVTASGNAISVRLPPEVLAGAKWLFVGVDVFTGVKYADHSTLQLIRLLR